MLRTPTLAKDRLPPCFGVSHATKNPLCRRCPVAARCRPFAQAWSAHRSLSELCASAEAATSALSIDASSIERIYDHEFERHFGRPSFRKRTSKNDVIFGALFALCLREDIDPATYIAANMRALRPFVSQYGFQPNMLSGERARGRYNAFIRHANRRYKRGLSDVAEGETQVGRLRRELAFAEEEVGGLFVRFIWIGSPISWSEAVDQADPSPLWMDFQAGHGAAYRDWHVRFGTARLEREKRIASLRAAVAVANSFQAGLADRVGVTEFSWKALADLIVRTFAPPEPAKFDLTGIPGGLWR